MKMMTSLWNLPNELVVAIFKDWLRLESICVLDSAGCSEEWRKDFLDLISIPYFIFLEDRFTDLSSSVYIEFIMWLGRRNMSVNSLTLGNLVAQHLSLIPILLELLPKVQELTICCTDEMTNSFYLSLFASVASLKVTSLTIKGTFLTNELCEAIVFKNCSSFNGFKSIYLSSPKLTDASLQLLSKNCHSLTSITLWECSNLSEAGLVPLLLVNKNIERLIVQKCVQITEESHKIIANRCSALTNFVYTGSENTILDLSLLLLNNKKLFAFAGGFVSLSGFQNIRFDNNYCLALSQLRLSNITGWNNEQFAKVCVFLKHLSSFHITLNEAITETTIHAIATHCHELKSLGFYNCSVVCPTDILALLFQNCDKISDLFLMNTSFGNVVMDTVVDAISPYLSNVKQLNLSKSSLLTDNSLAFIGSRCVSLQRLSVNKCHLLTYNGVKKVLTDAKDTLRYLSVISDIISGEQMHLLRNEFRSVTINGFKARGGSGSDSGSSGATGGASGV